MTRKFDAIIVGAGQAGVLDEWLRPVRAGVVGDVQVDGVSVGAVL